VKEFGKAVRLKLNEVGCVFLRRGKGDHDIWTTSEGKRIVVPVHIKSRHTANGILKDAVLPKEF
jgi:predicted RNA binding protein YcfA (HicA-like mRNA interferase family)